MRTHLALVVALLTTSLIACEGPAGPQGPIGPTGPQGETGSRGPRGPQGENAPPQQGTIIERRLSSALYDADGSITIEDDRITPTTFQALYLKINIDLGFGTADVDAYMPIDYFLINLSTYVPSEAALLAEDPLLPILMILEGGLLIVDSNQTILGAAEEAETAGTGNIRLAILVSP